MHCGEVSCVLSVCNFAWEFATKVGTLWPVFVYYVTKCYYGDQIKRTRNEKGGACRIHGDMRNASDILVGKPERKRLLGRFRRRRKECGLDASGSG
jgi:hypothetical protein